MSEAVKPIIYYMDPGCPEPIRSALMEGTSWWNQAFEAAGFRNAFQVKVLPPDADPMDVRYNMINWVHRSTRGWSIGSSITDPRTDKRIDFVGGIRGTAELEKLVNSGEYACAFSMFPTSIEDLMSIADAGGIMPPKSTWFEPKLRDAMFCHMI